MIILSCSVYCSLSSKLKPLVFSIIFRYLLFFLSIHVCSSLICHDVVFIEWNTIFIDLSFYNLHQFLCLLSWCILYYLLDELCLHKFCDNSSSSLTYIFYCLMLIIFYFLCWKCYFYLAHLQVCSSLICQVLFVEWNTHINFCAFISR